MNATLGEIALNHALSHDIPVDDVLLENVEGAAEVVAAHKEGVSASNTQQAQKTHDRDHDGEKRAAHDDQHETKAQPTTFRGRAEALLAKAEELTRENPRKALAIAAGAGLVVGVSILSVPVLRTVAKRAALSAIKGGGVAGLGSELGGQALEKLEGLLGSK